MTRILVIEDEPKVARALRSGLERAGYQVVPAATGEEGFFLATSQVFDLILLDLMLPRRDGFEVLEALRQKGSKTPVVILTARDAVEDRVAGLDRGADDYLVKPFAFPELLARIRARVRAGRSDDGLRLGLADLEMDVATRAVTRAGRLLDLTVREVALLEFLLRPKGQDVPRE